ncbi:MAG TPA: hypothetical protein DEF35_21705 [Paenibacillus sp.]|nr:hypothetical protein CA599_23040 [Paenibacillus taichungensis]HBU84236.1 hypothetical protein [Paenibacillus sp.]
MGHTNAHTLKSFNGVERKEVIRTNKNLRQVLLINDRSKRNSEKPEWYPGDDVVDIVSVDVYPKAGDHSPLAERYEILRVLVNDSKIIALAENGSIPDPKQHNKALLLCLSI